MTKVYDVCLAKKNAKGEYLKNKDGKSVYENWGSVLKDDKGYLSLVLKTMQGDIWFTLFEAKDGKTTSAPTIAISGVDDEVPF